MVRKKLVIVAYDIHLDKRRIKLAEYLDNFGKRINLSVFECMFTETELKKTISVAGKIIDTKTDQVVYYTICLNCYTKIVMQPVVKKNSDLTEII